MIKSMISLTPFSMFLYSRSQALVRYQQAMKKITVIAI
jgi:hypothetical protein